MFLMLLKLEYFQKENKEMDLQVFQIRSNHKQLRILTPKQILLRLPIALEQVKAGTEKLSK